ncbi:CLAVATA3/ESR (CLE)-related protein 43 [Raphanus sativus]|uniref:CLAVATA3/ESR (CLE)-related protein 43 n=1 Tax=Raphanus sativus TaxID=3726 RepID=A0A9W3DLC0_RAPSA|nr:CLAVATA3/ESR (CLE)-related protein 43 [Raphanus sativus]
MSQRHSTPVIFIFPPSAPTLHLIIHILKEERWSFLNITHSDLLVIPQTTLSHSFFLIETFFFFFLFVFFFFMGCRDVLLTFSVALLLTSLFHIWLFRERQFRELSEDNQLGRERNTLVSKNKKDDDDVQRLFQRYFKGSSLGLTNNSNTHFEDSDRKIPSSPDRLHN